MIRPLCIRIESNASDGRDEFFIVLPVVKSCISSYWFELSCPSCPSMEVQVELQVKSLGEMQVNMLVISILVRVDVGVIGFSHFS